MKYGFTFDKKITLIDAPKVPITMGAQRSKHKVLHPLIIIAPEILP